jgi:succinyl-CoA synthetase beta subunit
VIRLLEDDTKAWLRDAGFDVPVGATAASADEAAGIAASIGAAVVIKALVPAGRRGKEGGILHARSPEEAAAVTHGLLGQAFADHLVREVYVEQAIAIARELYCAFLFDDEGPRIVVGAEGGIDIESIAQDGSSALIAQAIDPLRGLPAWIAIDLWRRAGIRGPVLRALGHLTSRLHAQFVAGDAELLEINPLAIDADGSLVVVVAMAGIDPAALPRQTQWRDAEARAHPLRAPTLREERVSAADAALPGPEARYVELEGDIGLLVGGGGAGLYQHDRMLAHGGRPANHSVTPPTGADNRKLRTVIDAILDHPHIRGLLVGFNFAQMARADIRVDTLMDALDAKGIDTTHFPVVVRLFGAGEAQARARVRGREGIHYLPREASLDDAVRLIVSLTAAAPRSEAAA